MGIIYKVTNRLNSHCYIGQTVKTLKRRWQRHVSQARSGASGRLYDAIRKYGEQSFVVEVLHEIDGDSLDEVERQEIRDHGSFGGRNYNMTIGGTTLTSERHPWTGRKHTLESRRLMSVRQREAETPERSRNRSRAILASYANNPERLARCMGASNPFFGREHSPETKEKIAKKTSTRSHTEQVRAKMAIISRERFAAMSVEERSAYAEKRIAAVRLGYKSRTPEHIAECKRKRKEWLNSPAGIEKRKRAGATRTITNALRRSETG